MESILTVVHIIASFVLIVIILLQSGKGQGVAAGLGGASGAAKKMFGGGHSQSALGKATIAIGSLYLITSISLAFLASQPDSAMDLQQGDENFGARQGTVIETGGDDGASGDEQGATTDETSDQSDSPTEGSSTTPGQGETTGDSAGDDSDAIDTIETESTDETPADDSSERAPPSDESGAGSEDE